MWKTDAFLETSLSVLQTLKQQLIEKLIILAIVGVALFATLASAAAGARFASAASPAYAEDASFMVLDKTVTVLAGSSVASLETFGDRFTVTLDEGDVVSFRMPSNGHFVSHGAAIDTCEYREGSNYLTLSEPGTYTLSVDGRICNSTYGDAEVVSVSRPQAGATVTAGEEVLVVWSAAGSVFGARLSLSLDGGLTYPTVLVANTFSADVFVWTVPQVLSTDMARIRVEALGSSTAVVAVGVSAPFSIDGIAPPPEPEPQPATWYDAEEATRAALTIGHDRGIVPGQLPSGTVTCAANARIKGTSSSAVYYCGADGKRYAFPNQRVHDSWYLGFEGVITLTDAELAAAPLGGTVTYRPGVRLVKITTDPKVYAVAANGELRWVTSEAVAVALYGADWATKVDDIPDAFFTDYRIGIPIE